MSRAIGILVGGGAIKISGAIKIIRGSQSKSCSQDWP